MQGTRSGSSHLQNRQKNHREGMIDAGQEPAQRVSTERMRMTTGMMIGRRAMAGLREVVEMEIEIEIGCAKRDEVVVVKCRW
jgi:hypothetical protein